MLSVFLRKIGQDLSRSLYVLSDMLLLGLFTYGSKKDFLDKSSKTVDSLLDEALRKKTFDSAELGHHFGSKKTGKILIVFEVFREIQLFFEPK